MLRIHLNLDGHLFRLAENLGFHLELGQTTKTNPFGSCSRFTLRTHNEWAGKIDRLGEPFLAAQFQEPVALHLG